MSIKIFSIHLPKTGGQSFQTYLAEKFGNDVHWYGVKKLPNSGKDLDLSDLTDYIPTDKSVIHGHFKYAQIKNLHEKNPDAKVIFWLRNPVARIISHYFYIQNRIQGNPNHHFKDTIGKMTLLEFAQDPRFINLYSKWLKGFNYKDAYFIGILERFDHDLEILSDKLGFPAEKVYKVNTNIEFKNKHHVPEDVLQQIREINKKDIDLYNKVTQMLSEDRKNFDRVCLASFPRSGNTFFRNLFYEVYGMESASYDYPTDDAKVITDSPVIKTHLQPKDLPIASTDPIIKLGLIRDARDSILSNAHHRKDIIEPGSDFTQNLREVVLAQGGSYFGGWAQNTEDWIEDADYIIRYEDLVKDNEAMLRAMADQLHLPEGQYDRIPSFEDLKFGNPKYGPRKKAKDTKQKEDFKKQFFRKGKAGGWKEDFPADILEDLWQLQGETMLKCGYTRDGVLKEISPYLFSKYYDKIIKPGKAKVDEIRVLYVLDNVAAQPNDVKTTLHRLIDEMRSTDLMDGKYAHIDLLYKGAIMPLSEFNWEVEQAQEVVAGGVFNALKKVLGSEDSLKADYDVVHYLTYEFRKNRSLQGKKTFVSVFHSDSIDLEQPIKATILSSITSARKKQAAWYKNAVSLPLYSTNPLFSPENNNDLIHPVLIKYAIDGGVPYILFDLTYASSSTAEHALRYCQELRSIHSFDDLRMVVLLGKDSNSLGNQAKLKSAQAQFVDRPTDEEKKMLFAACLLAVLPDDNNLLQNRVVDALKCHCPTVVTCVEISMTPEHLKTPIDSFFLHEEKLSSYVEKLLHNPEFKQEEIFKSKKAANDFTPRSTLLNLFEIYTATSGNKSLDSAKQ